jgi:hydroxylamine reductase
VLFCNQCEQATHVTACVTSPGVCGKSGDVQSWQDLLLNGLRGLAAFAQQARRLDRHHPATDEFVQESLYATGAGVNIEEQDLYRRCLECGKICREVLEMLRGGHDERFGRPGPATVPGGTSRGPGILVTGSDLRDLAVLLEQVASTDLKVYTHGEMIAAHMYPRLRGHPNLAGHYGGAWSRQQSEFRAFSGAILATGGSLMPPDPAYAGRLFTTRAAALPGSTRLVDGDLTPVVEAALSSEPLPEDARGPTDVGVEVERSGRPVVAVGGSESEYFARFADAATTDAFVLTFGEIRGRCIGQLSDVIRLPDFAAAKSIHVALSWYGARSVALLLALFELGVAGVTLGPRPPAFLSPTVFDLLQVNHRLELSGDDVPADLARTLAASRSTSIPKENHA